MATSDKNIVSQFLYFMWNRWNKEMCIQIYGAHMGEYFWNKYESYWETKGMDAAFIRLYAEMTDNYRDDLVNAAIKYYENK